MRTSSGDLKEKNNPQDKAVFVNSSAPCAWEFYEGGILSVWHTTDGHVD